MKPSTAFRVLLVCVAAVLAIVVGVIATVYSRSSQPRLTATLSDGSLVTLNRVTYGRRHASNSLPSWDTIKKMWKARTFRRPDVLETREDKLILWTSKTNYSNSVQNRYAAPHFLVVSDSKVGGSAIMSDRGGPGSIHFFKRRGNTIELDALDYVYNSDPRKVGTWRISNPVWQRFPTWTPGTLPQTQSIAGLRLGIRNFQHTPAREITNRPRASISRADQITVTLFEAGGALQKSGDYERAVRSAILSDCTGNSINGEVEQRNTLNTDLAFSGNLDLDEVWKLQLEVARVFNQPNDTWIVRLPSSQSSSVALTNHFLGETITVSGPVPLNNEFGYGPCYVIRSSNTNKLAVRIMKLVDAEGAQTSFASRPGGEVGLPLDMLSASQTGYATVTIAITRREWLEYVFRPPRAKPPMESAADRTSASGSSPR